MNDYDSLANLYKQTHTKPDKLYSILPTILKLVANAKGKIILDLGCGDGFFTRALAEQNTGQIIGIDNSATQLKLAKENTNSEKITYLQKNIFIANLPRADVILAAFVLNYSKTLLELQSFIHNIYKALNPGGRFIAVVDLPNGQNLQRFGAIKKLCSQKDETPIIIKLFSNENFICDLKAVYFTQKTIDNTCQQVGFQDILWHKPIVSATGLKKYGINFWQGYIESCELGYITAQK